MTYDKQIAIVCNARFHDDTMAVGELTRLCFKNKNDRIVVGGNFGILDGLVNLDGIVLMNCNLLPVGEDLTRLVNFVEAGTRLFGLHASNNHVGFRDGPPFELGGGITLPGAGFSDDRSPGFNEFLGSKFYAHLPYGDMSVTPTKTEHPITAGINAFKTVDEPYVMDVDSSCQVHMVSRLHGKAVGYELEDWPEPKDYPVMYSKRVGRGEVAYLALGHCCGPHDLAEFVDNVQPLLGSWATPEFKLMLERSVMWLRHEI